MKKTSSITALLCIAFVLFSFGNNRAKEGDEIPWTAHQLSWDDFQGTPNNASNYGAVTSSGMSYNYHYQGAAITIEVKAIFYRKQSWVKPIGRDESGLKHEQGHFDLAELYARKLRKALRDASFNKRNVKAKLNDLYKSNSKAWEKEENRYDKETNHHINTANQQLWNAHIATELSKYAAYTDTHIAATIQ